MTNQDQGARTLARGLDVLEALQAALPGGLYIAELSRATSGLDRAVLYRMLHTLAEYGMVERDDATRRWRATVAFVPPEPVRPTPTWAERRSA